MRADFNLGLWCLCLFLLSLPLLLAFQSDELLADDDEFFGLEGARSPDLDLARSPDLDLARSPPPHHPPSSSPSPSTRKRSLDSDSDSKIQFSLDHSFGDSHFSSSGTFTARLKTWSHGGQTLTKLRFSRNSFTETEKESFRKLLEDDDFYMIRVPSNVLSPPGREYIISSVKARCLPRDGLDEHFVIHMEGVNILAVNYGSPGTCQYPRQMKLPAKWSFNSHTILKNSEMAPRTPAFAEETLGGVNVEGEGVQPPERSLWAKYWMYLIPLGLIVMNAITQAMNMPEEQAAGQSAAQSQQSPAAIQRGQSTVVRRR